ncbi:MAG: hypothetical protein J1D77_00610 [Muribaculaceae bacterium]|nr:hypothetical protein [Muribaculaceae bacterium]
MNKINKYLSLAAVATLGAGWLASCDNSKNNDFVSEYDGAPGIYFSNTETSYLELDDNKSTITYNAYRDVAGEEITVALAVEPLDDYENNDIYTFPTSVTFPAGSRVGEIVIGYDIAKAPIGEEQQYLFALDAEPNPFSSNQTVVTLVNPAPWELLGTGEYYDYWWGISTSSVGPATVTFYQQAINRNIYRITNPYYALNEEPSYFQFQVLQPGDNFLGVDITLPDLVGYDMVYLEYDPEDSSDVYVTFPGYFQNWSQEAAWTTNYVVEYQDNGLPGLIYLAPIYFWADSGNGGNTSLEPTIEIYFPGYTHYDATLEVTYLGTLTPEDQSQYVLLSVDLGTDITEARAAVSADLSGDELIAAIEEGKVDYTTVTSSGNVQIPFDEMETGTYNIAVVAYVEDDVKNTYTNSFFYIASDSDYDPNEGWTSLGYVEYTDGFVVAFLFTGTDEITYEVEIQENDETPGLYRLVNPYGTYFAGFFGDQSSSKDTPAKYITIDATDPVHVKLLQDSQVITFFGEVSMMSTWSYADMYEQEGYSVEIIEGEDLYGSLTDGVITFPATSLASMWSDEPGEYYAANYALDYDAYQAGSRNPYYFNEDGTMFAPFRVDFNTLVPNLATQANSVALPSKSFNLNQSSTQLKVKHMPKSPKSKNTPARDKKNLKQVRKFK